MGRTQKVVSQDNASPSYYDEEQVVFDELERQASDEIRLESKTFDYALSFKLGSAAVFGTAAYWIYQWKCNPTAIAGTGRPLLDEVLYCMLGGFGITGEMSNAYYDKITCAVRSSTELTPDRLEALLREPVSLHGRPVRYRYPKQKSQLICKALRFISNSDFNYLDPVALRDKLQEAPGIGPKTASWIVRNRVGSADVAILDIHLHRAGVIAGFFRPEWRPAQHYLMMEDAYLKFAKIFGLSPAGLDLLIWNQMRVRKLPREQVALISTKNAPRPKASEANLQLILVPLLHNTA